VAVGALAGTAPSASGSGSSAPSSTRRAWRTSGMWFRSRGRRRPRAS